MEQKFCPHCNPCRRASEITKAEAERDALRALLLETENKRTDIPGFVRWYSLWCARVDAALAQDSER